MNFTDLLQEVIDETKRPDLRTRITSQIRQSTQAVHMAERWPRDLATEIVTFAQPTILGDFEYTNIPLFRKADAIYPSVGGVKTSITAFKEVKAFSQHDVTGEMEANYWYLAGNKIVVGSQGVFEELLVTYLKNPDCLGNTYSSWIADEYPYLIVYHATASILERIGARDLAQKARSQAAEQFKYMQSALI